jgi:pimeloyl-ACP methyl ester carboxylesterase
MIAFVWFLLLVAVAYAWRARLLYRVGAPRQIEAFDGVVYRVGAAAIAERASRGVRATVIGMHGLLENPCYFTRYYADPDIQLILLTSGDYHVPFAAPQYRTADWARTPDHELGTIEYDAAVLVQAVEHLPKTRSIRVHGHSRGGAVTLEAAAMRPDLFRDVEVILEAPVLPRGEPRRPVPRVARWFIPFYLALWRRQPISPLSRYVFGRLDDERKRTLVAALPFNSRRLVTVMRNLESLETWMQQREVGVYENVGGGAILIADDDQVLAPDAMRAAAQPAQGRLRIVEVGDCSHFVLLDRPDALPPLRKDPIAATDARGNRASPGDTRSA